MKKIFAVLMAVGAMLLSSCGEGIRQRPLSNSSKEIVVSRGPVVASHQNLFVKYGIKFWDELDFDTYPTPTMQGGRFVAADNPNANIAKGRMHAAYRLGNSFASDDNMSVSQRLKLVKLTVPQVIAGDSTALFKGNSERFFLSCVEEAEANSELGMSAIMVGGYYLGYMKTVLECRNPESHLPDDRVIAKSINKLGNLKSYLNNVLSSEKELAVASVIQKMVLSADRMNNIYNNANLEPSEKYSELLGEVRNVDSFFN